MPNTTIASTPSSRPPADSYVSTPSTLRLWCGTSIPFCPYSRIYLSSPCRYTLTPQLVASRSLDHPVSDCCIARSAPNMRLQPLRHGWMRRSCMITIGTMQLPPLPNWESSRPKGSLISLTLRLLLPSCLCRTQLLFLLYFPQQ